MHPSQVRAEQTLTACFSAAIAAVAADAVLPRHLPTAPGGRLVVIAAGKAAAPMMAAAQARSAAPLAGLVVAPRGHIPPDFDLPAVEIITAGHPVPDANSQRAAERAMQLATALGASDHLLMLMSGGASALLAAPVANVTLADKAAVTLALLRSGAPIAEINTVRMALSSIKGGRLAALAAPADVTTWVVSDVPGDDLALVGSGPTIAVAPSGESAAAIIARRAITVPTSVATALAHQHPVAATSGQVRCIASARDALRAAAQCAAALGFAITNLGDDLQGEARYLGRAHAALALGLAAQGGRHAIISGGETSVTMVGRTGRGGRNLEYCLGLAIALDGAAGVTALAADSDGIDGTSHAAGAWIGPDTLVTARALGLDPIAFLAANDAHGLFAAVGNLVVTGPTLTNVNDIRVILVG